MQSITPSFSGSKEPKNLLSSKIKMAPNTFPSTEFRWAVGVTTCKRPEGQTVERTVDSLIATGWSNIELFNDGQISSMPKNFFDHPRRQDVRIHDRPRQIGAYGNFLCALTELIQTFPTADAFLMVQDDVVFARNCRQYLEATFRNAKLRNEGVVWSLYCSGTDYDDFLKRKEDTPGWKKTNRGWGMLGALTVVFTLRDAISFLSSLSTHLHRIELGPKSDRQIDAEIGKWARENAKPAMFHHPSLAQHTGEHSSIYKSIDLMSDRRSSPSFVGEDRDALDFLKKEEKPSIVEKKDIPTIVRVSESSSLRYGIYGTLGLSPTGFATARLADIEQTSSILAVNEPGFPARPVSCEASVTFCQDGGARTKVAAAFKNCDVVFTVVPMSATAISWLKANDRDIVSLVFDLPEEKKGQEGWKATIRASSLVLTPFESIKALLTEMNARSVEKAVPEALAPRLAAGRPVRRGLWAAGRPERTTSEHPLVVFTSNPSSVKTLPGRSEVFDLTKRDHDDLLAELEQLSFFEEAPMMSGFGPLILRNWIVPMDTMAKERDANELSLILDADLENFLKEKMRRF